MAYIYNHMPSEIYANKMLSSTAKLVMERIFSLSKDGSQTVFFNRDKFSAELGVAKTALTRAFQELLKAEYIETVKNTHPFDRTRTFKITEKGLFTDSSKIERSIVLKQNDRQEQSRTIESSKTEHSIVLKQDDREYINRTVDRPEIELSESPELERSTVLKQNDLHQIDHIEKKKDVEVDISSSLTFDSVFSQMLKINEEEFTPKGTGFDEEDIRSDARTYTMKFKGKPTRDSMYKWMISGDERRRDQRKTQLESNQNSTVPLPKKMTAAQIRAGLLAHQKKYGPASPFYVGGDYEY